MPKIYSKTEKENIREDLRANAKVCLVKYGVRRTTVDELVKMTNIPKGTFYLFYKSKEHLFLDVIEDFNRKEEDRILGMLQELDENHIVSSLTKVFTDMVMDFYNAGIYRFLDGGQMDIILRKLSKEEQERARESHNDYIRQVLNWFLIDDERDIEEFDAAINSLFYLLLHSDEINDMEKALRAIVRGLVLQLVE